jgi:hypothetical protein
MKNAVRFIEYPFAENIGVRGGIVGSKIYPKVYARLVETIRNRAKYPSRNDKPNSLLNDFYYKRNSPGIQRKDENKLPGPLFQGVRKRTIERNAPCIPKKSIGRAEGGTARTGR